MSYGRGYRDGYAGRAKSVPDNGISAINDDIIGGTIRPFADYDYEQGYSAGANDAKWTRHCVGAGLRDNNGRSMEAE
jgi:hypothetical protein